MNDSDDMVKMVYDCKVCGKGGVTSCHKNCPTLNLNIWLANLTCNRCCDFERKLIRKKEQIASIAHSMNPVMKPKPEVLSQLENGLRSLVQQSCDIITDFLRLPRSTYPDLMNGAVRDPQQAWPGILWFRGEAFKQAGWRRQSNHQPELVEEPQEAFV